MCGLELHVAYGFQGGKVFDSKSPGTRSYQELGPIKYLWARLRSLLCSYTRFPFLHLFARILELIAPYPCYYQ